MAMNKRTILRIGFFSAVTLTLCAVVLCLAITPLINTEQVKGRLTKALQNETGITVRFNQLAFILSPLPSLRIIDISAQLDPKNKISIDKALVELSPLQLLKFKTAVRRITLQSPELILNKTVSKKNKFTAPPRWAASVQTAFDRLFDLPLADRNQLDIIITHARSSYFATMDARIRIAARTKALNIEAQVSGLQLETDRIPNLESALKGRIKNIETPNLSLECRHDKNTLFAGNLKITSLRAHLESPKDNPIITKKVHLKFAMSKKRVTACLSPLKLVYPKGRVGINLSLSPGQEASSLEFTGEQIDIRQARQVCLPLLKGFETSEILFDILRSGTAQKVTVGFKSEGIDQLFNTKNIFISGCSDSTTVKIPHVPVIVDNASGRAEMKDGILQIHPESGHVGQTIVTGGDLDINLIHQHTVPFSGRFPLKLDLAELPAALISMLPGTSLAREMSKISDLTGSSEAILELENTNSHKDLGVKVIAKNIHAIGKYRPIPLPIQINGGSFLLDNRKVVLRNMSGAIGNSKISKLNAEIDTRGLVPMHIKNMAANIILEQALPLVERYPGVPQKLGPMKNTSGIMIIKALDVKGPMFSPNLWQAHMTGQVDKGSVVFNNNTNGISDLFFQFKAAPSTITLADIACTVKDLTWLEKNISAQYNQSITLPLTLTQGQFVKQPDGCLFQGQLLTTSGTKVLCKADGPTINKISLSQLKIKDGERTDADVTFYKNPEMPKINFAGKLDKTTLENLLYTDSYLYRQLREVAGAKRFTISTDQTNNITITADTLNLAPLLPAKEPPVSTAPPRPLFKQEHIFLNVNTLDYDQREYQRVQAKATMNQSVTDIDITHATLCDLDLSGRITINHAGDNSGVLTRIFFNTDQAKEVSLSLGCLTGSQSVIEGRYTLVGELSGVGQSLTQAKFKQNGHLNFKAQSGRIFKATLLSRVLSVVNILGETDIQQQGFGFKTFTANADIKDSVVHIKNAVIDADNMAIIAEGWADPLNDALDITLLVAPFKTIDTIIKYIPIVNTILNGRLVSFPIRAYGKISDPTVVPLHPSAVGKGLLNLLGDLVKTPGRLIEGIKDNEK